MEISTSSIGLLFIPCHSVCILTSLISLSPDEGSCVGAECCDLTEYDLQLELSQTDLIGHYLLLRFTMFSYLLREVSITDLSNIMSTCTLEADIAFI